MCVSICVHTHIPALTDTKGQKLIMYTHIKNRKEYKQHWRLSSLRWWTLKMITKAETPIFWPSDAKNWLIWKDSDAEKDWRGEEKRMTEDETVGWHHQLKEHEFE